MYSFIHFQVHIMNTAKSTVRNTFMVMKRNLVELFKTYCDHGTASCLVEIAQTRRSGGERQMNVAVSDLGQYGQIWFVEEQPVVEDGQDSSSRNHTATNASATIVTVKLVHLTEVRTIHPPTEGS